MMTLPSSSSPLVLSLVLLLSPFHNHNPTTSHAIESHISITPSNPTYTLIQTQKITNAAWSPPWFSNASPFLITSDIPVSLLRYGDRSSMDGVSEIVGGNGLMVYITTDCVDGGGGIDVAEERDGNGEVSGLIITKQGSDDVDGNDGLLEDSLFHASWNVSHPWCDPPPQPQPEPKSPTEPKKPNQASLRMAPNDMVTLQWPSSSDSNDHDIFATSESNDHDITATSSNTNSSCTYLAEILYDGCYRKLQTTAPIVKTTNVTLSNVSSTPGNNPQRPCTFHYEASMDLTIVETLTEMPVDTESFNRRHCMRIAPGRPYFDSLRGDDLTLPMMADVVVSNEGESSPWLTTTTTEIMTRAEVAMTPIITSNSSLSPHHTSPTTSTSSTTSWLHQGLGEHASIASFAKLAITLLTNNAPPSLIRDTLRAAIDEVDHTTRSFHHASSLAGTSVGPGPLPSSVHHFDANLKELVRGVWREGCVDETMAALIAARDAGRMGGGQEEEKRTMMIIAMDESRHASLAWRMVRWACSRDDDEGACRREELLGGGDEGGEEEVRREWERIYRRLIRVVVDGEEDGNEEGLCVDGEGNGNDGREEMSLLRNDMGSDRMMEVVRDDIIRRVICHSD